MDKKVLATEEQLAYAKLLDAGMKVGLLILIVTFIVYLTGILTPHVPVNDLPNYWKMPVHTYLAATGIHPGWAWLGMLGKGDFLNFIGIAFLAGVTIICYIRIIPILLRKKTQFMLSSPLLKSWSSPLRHQEYLRREVTDMKESCVIMGFEKILLATDGSESAEAAIQEAINIAKVCSGSLYVLSVVEVNPEYEALAPEIVEKAETETKEHLDSVKKKAEKEGIACEIIVHQGEEPYRFIVDEAAKIKADMIVMGSHGRTGIKRLMMGSVTSRVIGHAPCKVLVVPS